MNRISMFAVGFVAAFTLLTTTTQAQETSVDAIIKAHMESLGGAEAIGKIKTINRSGRSTAAAPLNYEGTVKQVAVVGNKAYQNTDMGAFWFTTRWDGTVGWKEEAGQTAKEAGREDLSYLKTAVAISPLLSAWRQYGTEAIKVLPDETQGGKTFRVLQIAESKGKKFYLDKKSHLLTRVILNEAFTFQMRFNDYARHEGVQLPGEMVFEFFGDNNDVVFHFKYDQTTINEDVDDSLFVKP